MLLLWSQHVLKLKVIRFSKELEYKNETTFLSETTLLWLQFNEHPMFVVIVATQLETANGPESEPESELESESIFSGRSRSRSRSRSLFKFVDPAALICMTLGKYLQGQITSAKLKLAKTWLLCESLPLFRKLWELKTNSTKQWIDIVMLFR